MVEKRGRTLGGDGVPIPGIVQKPCGMWHLGTWIGGGLGSAGLKGFSILKGSGILWCGEGVSLISAST